MSAKGTKDPMSAYVGLPTTMKALRYERPKEHRLVDLPLPTYGDNDVLVKIIACGVCGTDLHLHNGDLPEEFPAKYPVVPGHEPVGQVVALGKNITRLSLGQRVVCDANVPCNDCLFCLRGEHLLCERIKCHGVTVNGGFAEYCAYPASKVVPIQNLTDLEAILVEPASCAVQMLDRIKPAIGSSAIVFGSGPVGLLIAQLLKHNGGCKVVVASLPGAKLDLARKLQVADDYVEVDTTGQDSGLTRLSQAYPHGFEIVIEATGVPKVLENSIDYVRRGGTLAVFGVYNSEARVSWSPSKILGNQITIIGSIAEVIRFPVAVDYLDSRKVKVDGIVNKTFKLDQWDECLASLKRSDTVKAAIVFD